MNDWFTSLNIIMYVVCAVANTGLLVYSSSKFFLASQQFGYKNKPYLKWSWSYKNPYMPRLIILVLLGVLFGCLVNVCFASVLPTSYSGQLGFLAYACFLVVFIVSESYVIDTFRASAKRTRRLIRLNITSALLFLILTAGIMILSDFITLRINDSSLYSVRYIFVFVTPVLSPLVIALANLLNYPFERWNSNRYIRRTKAQLAASSVLKIGITGSYGKTSVKNILSTILSQRYRVLVTPASYNTPLGVSLSVKKLNSTHDIFIAEMGARRVGDIADLASIVKPEIAVLTGVNTQHLETFKTEENIKNTKFELFESLSENGKGFFSADSEGSVELFEKFGGQKYKSGVDGEDNFVTAKNVKFNNGVVSFDLCIQGEKPVSCETNLLGKHNISNICLASSVAYSIGMTPNEIALGINRLVAIKHRLELLPNNKNIILIDDSYNSNEKGVEAAFEVMQSFEGRKIVVTPGLVELGGRENIANLELGKRLSQFANVVVVVGKHNAEMIIQGLINNGFEKSNIVFAKNRGKASEKLNSILVPGDVVLFENDLPDTYQ